MYLYKNSQIDVVLCKSSRQEITKEEEGKAFHKKVIYMLIDIAKTLGRQGLAFRGSDVAENDNGNFKQIVNLLTWHNPILKRWHDETSSRSHNVSYLSSQKELIFLLGKKVRKAIVSEVLNAGEFSVTADTNPDLLHHDRQNINIRYVIEKNEKLIAVERLFKIDIVLSKKTGKELAKKNLYSFEWTSDTV